MMGKRLGHLLCLEPTSGESDAVATAIRVQPANWGTGDRSSISKSWRIAVLELTILDAYHWHQKRHFL